MIRMDLIQKKENCEREQSYYIAIILRGDEAPVNVKTDRIG